LGKINIKGTPLSDGASTRKDMVSRKSAKTGRKEKRLERFPIQESNRPALYTWAAQPAGTGGEGVSSADSYKPIRKMQTVEAGGTMPSFGGRDQGKTKGGSLEKNRP